MSSSWAQAPPAAVRAVRGCRPARSPQTTIFLDPAAPGSLQDTIFVDPTAPGSLQNTIFVDPAPPGGLQNTCFVDPTASAATETTIFADPASPEAFQNIVFVTPVGHGNFKTPPGSIQGLRKKRPMSGPGAQCLHPGVPAIRQGARFVDPGPSCSLQS